MRIFVDDCKDIRSILKKTIGVPSKERHGGESFFQIGAGFDCETTKTPKGFSYVYLWQFAIKDTVFMGRTTKSFENFIILLDKVLIEISRGTCHSKQKKYPQLLIYDCNMGYEWAHFKKNLYRCGITSVFAKEKRQPLKICVGRCLQFREALGVWGYSLDNIAKTYTKTQKMVGDLDFTIPRNSYTILTEEKELKYCENDVLILSELCMIAFEKYRGQSIPYTQTGIIRSAVKRRIQEKGKLTFDFHKERVHKLYPKTIDDYHIMMDYLFCGGWAHANYMYVSQIIDTGVICADLTSDYPACMVHHTYPAGTMLSNCTLEDMQRFPHWWAFAEFTNIKSKCGHSLISEHKLRDKINVVIDNGRVYKAEIIGLYITEIDLQNIDMIYNFDTVTFTNIHCFTRSEKIPQELFAVLTEQYKIKNDLKHIKPKTEDQERQYAESKKYVNGCFGFTATRIYTTEIVLNDDEQDLEEKKTDKNYEELIKDVWLNPWIAVYTTAYARRIICKVVSEFPSIIIQYDTDSIYFKDGLPDSEKLKEYLLAYNEGMKIANDRIFHDDSFSDLGCWDFDEYITKFKTLGAKRYIKETETGIHPVCVGCKPKAYVKYCEESERDPFEYFDEKMNLPNQNSMKTTLKYYDKGGYKDTITDRQGNVQEVEIETCGVITQIPFNLFMSHLWLDWLKYMYEKEKQL